MEWQPIETAPRDGTKFIGVNVANTSVMYECSWEAMDTPLAKYWGIPGSFWRKPIRSGADLLGDWQPTHWIHSPLLPPPLPPSQEK